MCIKDSRLNSVAQIYCHNSLVLLVFFWSYFCTLSQWPCLALLWTIPHCLLNGNEYPLQVRCLRSETERGTGRDGGVSRREEREDQVRGKLKTVGTRHSRIRDNTERGSEEEETVRGFNKRNWGRERDMIPQILETRRSLMSECGGQSYRGISWSDQQRENEGQRRVERL